ncbi:N-acetylmuramoyl-L-alanine amidase [Pseudorhodobacter ferrugineus]|uniref:N-acetylmuramoyl-L-alanine amidase n=1 Tax=Pseudorhodobacter ferrugineus TaxID=77008 RepID=UPI0003B3A91D|nr:N-acetylmuramoyl-L-alanine amidase [Pseudorhodobacter ferrugineus]
MRAVLGIIATIWMGAAPVWAQDLSAIARLLPETSSITDSGRGVSLDLTISQSVPWRVRVLDTPPRLILDTREVDFAQIAAVPRRSDAVVDLRAGVFRPGWSRLVLELSGPFAVKSAAMDTAGTEGARINVTLAPASQQDFAVLAAAPEPEGWALPKPADVPKVLPHGAGPLVVVLDPGHGGIDPGAENDGHREADLVLTFAREFKEALQRSGDFLVILTRDEDVFVPLEARISVARAAGANVLISLHADALAEGDASGATLYTLSNDATDEASKALAERHDRDDLLAGIDLTEQDDLIAHVLMDMARTQTTPRVDRLAEALKAEIKAEGLRMHRKPIQSGGFSVLKSPDIPSILIELGFLSSDRDLAHLTDPAWRARMIAALGTGLTKWAAAEAALNGGQ